jgi:hypothetical protein
MRDEIIFEKIRSEYIYQFEIIKGRVIFLGAKFIRTLTVRHPHESVHTHGGIWQER